ncbi:MAG: type II toxin-antitoxin system VapC family toxin [Ornithinimicrobium sp.]
MLLDTHVALWLLADDPKLGREARATISSQTDVMVSTASLWEMAIKQASGKLTVPSDIIVRVEDAGVQWLDVRAPHAWAISTIEGLPHSDPFDRLLIAQAAIERVALMTADRTLLDFEGSPAIRLLDARI